MKTPASVEEIQAFIEEVIQTFRRLRILSSEIHGEGFPIPGQRGILMDLANQGDQTVPEMARARGVSRQNVQVLIDRFLDEGLVEMANNPAHKRSRLVRLSPAGKDLVRKMRQSEARALKSLGLKIPAKQVRKAAGVLRTMRSGLEKFPRMDEPPKSEEKSVR